MRSPLCALALTLLALGCSSAPPPEENEPTERRTELQVKAWSVTRQAAVGATGTITALSDGTVTPIDTRGSPEAGQTVPGLTPGQYRVEVTRRYEGERAVPCAGVEVIYVEPGVRAAVTVVVTDREQDLGLAPARVIRSGGPRRPPPTPPEFGLHAVALPSLPLAARRGG